MFKWIQGGLSAVAGTAEPEYGPDAIHPITSRIKKGENSQYHRSTTAKDFEWLSPNYTNVETQTFYFTDLATKNIGFAQIIHSNVMGVHTTAQFTFRLYNISDPSVNIWTSTKLENFKIEKSNFYADNLKLELIDNKKYILKSYVNMDSIVEFEMERNTDGIIFGDDGMTFYGDNKDEPWGSMRHLFWPRCNINGKIITKQYGEIKILNGLTMFVMALQGMKPHHAAKSWNFLNFQSSNYSAIQMEFTTPKSYNTTKVNIGIIIEDDKILVATINNDVIHIDSKHDSVGWPVPKAIQFKYIDPETKNDLAIVSGDLKNLVERVDVMAEIPQFVKNIVSGVAGAKPYIYQYANEFEIEILNSNEEIKKEEKGIGYTEVTFISE
ncbi:SVF1 [Candida pseudojiufengensis]|uniref:SVF1 n=1 Tax=Candida pseudojiufengensis TaxID=497109 RepID=UPI0022248F3E|nr:SVF1 [Candida pseudojiufengensis]KAI5966340.1 SVF1 [Candida pseudojiufengensis]